MANGGDARIDLRGDGRVILYKRKTLKILFGRLASVFQDQCEAERCAWNYYEEPSRDICYSRYIFLS